jgi:hypothetical protein
MSLVLWALVPHGQAVQSLVSWTILESKSACNTEVSFMSLAPKNNGVGKKVTVCVNSYYATDVWEAVNVLSTSMNSIKYFI